MLFLIPVIEDILSVAFLLRMVWVPQLQVESFAPVVEVRKFIVIVVLPAAEPALAPVAFVPVNMLRVIEKPFVVPPLAFMEIDLAFEVTPLHFMVRVFRLSVAEPTFTEAVKPFPDPAFILKVTEPALAVLLPQQPVRAPLVIAALTSKKRWFVRLSRLLAVVWLEVHPFGA